MKIQRICEVLPLVTLMALAALFLYSPLPVTEAVKNGIEYWQSLGASYTMAWILMTVGCYALISFAIYFPAKMAGKCLVRISKSKSDL